MSDDFEETSTERRNRFGIVVLMISAILFLLWPILLLLAGTKQQVVAVAEAESVIMRENRPVLPNDFNTSRAVETVALAPVASTDPMMYQVFVDTQDWCIPCRNDKDRFGEGTTLIKLNWVVGRPPEGIPELYPTYRWKNAQGQWVYISGSIPSMDLLIDKIVNNDPPQLAEPIGSAGAIRGKQQIIEALGFIRRTVGEGNRVTFQWGRTGNQTFSLLKAGTDWSPEAIFGKSGRIELTVDKAVVTSVGFQYRLVGDDLVIDADPVTVQGLAKWMTGKDQSFESSVGIDPASVLTILSVIRAVWQILNPSVDLEIGGTVQASAVLEGDVLLVTCKGGPKVRVTSAWKWLLEISELEISSSRVKIKFAEQRGWFPIRERSFVVQ